MATLQNVTTGLKIYLKSHHVFGRNREKADTFLSRRDISQIHASIRWDGHQWMLTDLSRNGIWIDGIRIEPGKSVVLKAGNTIRFSIITEEAVWKLTDISPPGTVLIPLNDHEPVIELNRFHVLPREDTPDISVYISPTGQWVYETENGVIPLISGDIIHHSLGSWYFFIAEPVDVTLQQHKPVDTRVLFYVSLDEEHVVIKIQHGQALIDLGERAHHYMLLTLARQRLNDAIKGMDMETQGWIEQGRMSGMLGMNPCHLNIHIFRIRKQISTMMPPRINLPQVVERRVGELRFGYPDFQIRRGSSVEGTLSGGKAA